MNEDSGEARLVCLWEIQCLGQSFKMLCQSPIDPPWWMLPWEEEEP